jgi:adenylate cyclase class IV
MKNGKKREVEIKLAVKNVAAARRAMADLKARDSGPVHEMNTIYDTPQNTLRKRGQLLRVRVVTTAQGKRWGVLTRKGPSIRTVERPRAQAGLPVPREIYKVRIENEMHMSQRQMTAEAGRLAAEGFAPAFRYEKYRTSYRLPVKVAWARRLVIELDGPRRAIDRAARLLGYARAEYITKSYVALWSEYCRRHGMRGGDMLFRRVRGRSSQKK